MEDPREGKGIYCKPNWFQYLTLILLQKYIPSHIQTSGPQTPDQAVSPTCAQHRGQGMKFTSALLGFCSTGDSKQVPQQLFFLHHFRNQRVITVYILPENLFTASYINLRQSLCWHSRKNNVKEPCAKTLLSSYYNHSKDLQLMFVLFLCAYQFDCHWLCPWLSIPVILAIHSCFCWCFHINNSSHN